MTQKTVARSFDLTAISVWFFGHSSWRLVCTITRKLWNVTQLTTDCQIMIESNNSQQILCYKFMRSVIIVLCLHCSFHKLVLQPSGVSTLAISLCMFQIYFYCCSVSIVFQALILLYLWYAVDTLLCNVVCCCLQCAIVITCIICLSGGSYCASV